MRVQPLSSQHASRWGRRRGKVIIILLYYNYYLLYYDDDGVTSLATCVINA